MPDSFFSHWYVLAGGIHLDDTRFAQLDRQLERATAHLRNRDLRYELRIERSLANPMACRVLICAASEEEAMLLLAKVEAEVRQQSAPRVPKRPPKLTASRQAILDELSKGPRTIREIGESQGIKLATSTAALRVLVANGLVMQDGERAAGYGNPAKVYKLVKGPK
jgi:hypothetical protein